MYMKLRVCLPSPQISMRVAAVSLGLDDLAADGGGGLLAAAVPGAEGAVDVVEAGDARLEPKSSREVAAHRSLKSFSQP
jgi:hypothetical protein